MQHVERVPQPHRGVRTPAYTYLILIALIVLAIVLGALFIRRPAPQVAPAASWANAEILATNPELKVVLAFEDALARRSELAFLEQNPELILMRGYVQAADEAFLARNPEIKVQRRYLQTH